MVKEKLTIYKAAKRLKICHPTAKFIMKSYRKNHHPKIEEDSPNAPPQECKQENVEQEPAMEVLPPNIEGKSSIEERPFVYPPYMTPFYPFPHGWPIYPEAFMNFRPYS